MSFYSSEKSLMIPAAVPGKKLHFVEDLAQTPLAKVWTATNASSTST